MKDIVKEPKVILKKYKKLLLQLDSDRSARFAKVKKIYKFIDDHNDEIFKKDTVCGKGCAHCCYMNVDVTEVEASYIAEYTKKPLNVNINSSVYADISKHSDIPCPFLDVNDSSCTIYDVRPSVCRMYHVYALPFLLTHFGSPSRQQENCLPKFSAGIRCSHSMRLAL